MSCIEASGLSKSYGRVRAVDSIGLSVESGQIFGFLGPNGAGKSTSIKLLTTLIPPSSGSISILGVDALADPVAVRGRIGVVLQQPSYEPTLSVEKSLDKYGMMWDVPRAERRRRTEQLLGDFDLLEIRKKRNVDLSIGQRRRVQVAREFMHDMELLFLDEPTVGLDPGARRRLLNYIKARADDDGLTIFYTTHILTEAEYFCDRVAIIDGGRIATVDTPDALKERFGGGKTIRIALREGPSRVSSLLSGIADCSVGPGRGANGGGGGGGVCTVTIHSRRSEHVLLEVLGALNGGGVAIDELSAVPTSLEDIFLRMVREDGDGDGDGRGGGA